MNSSFLIPDVPKLEARLLRLHISAKKALERSETLRKDAMSKVALYEKAAKALIKEVKALKKQGKQPTSVRTESGQPVAGAAVGLDKPNKSVRKRSPHAFSQAPADVVAPTEAVKRVSTTKKRGYSKNQVRAKQGLEGHVINAATPSAMDLPGLDETLGL